MSDKQPNCHTWSFRVPGVGACNNDHVEIRLISPLVAVPEASLTLGSVCQFSIRSLEQNKREYFIYSVCPHNRAAQPLCWTKVSSQWCPNYGPQANDFLTEFEKKKHFPCVLQVSIEWDTLTLPCCHVYLMMAVYGVQSHGQKHSWHLTRSGHVKTLDRHSNFKV